LIPLATLTLAQRVHEDSPRRLFGCLETLKDWPLRPEERRYASDLAGRARFMQGDYTLASTSFPSCWGRFRFRRGPLQRHRRRVPFPGYRIV